jgi:hypothetical protein
MSAQGRPNPAPCRWRVTGSCALQPSIAPSSKPPAQTRGRVLNLTIPKRPRDMRLASIGPVSPKSSPLRDRSAIPASNATGARRGRAEREPSCRPSSPSPHRHRRTWSCRANGKLEEIVHQALGLVLGVKQSEQVIAPGWKCVAIQHSRGRDRNSDF